MPLPLSPPPAVSLDQVLTSIIALAASSIQFRCDANAATPFNADAAILFSMPTLLRALEQQGFSVEQSRMLADVTLMYTMLAPQMLNTETGEHVAVQAQDIETAYAALGAVGLTHMHFFGGGDSDDGNDNRVDLSSFFFDDDSECDEAED